MANKQVLSGTASILILSLMMGCVSTERSLMPTPALYYQTPAVLFEAIAEERRRPMVDLLYITDRLPEEDPETGLIYGEERARSIAFGTAAVHMIPELTWSELKQQSQLAMRSSEIHLEMGRMSELGRFPDEPYAIEVTPSGVKRTAAVIAAHERTKAVFRTELQRRLAQSRNQEVLIYIHGFNETFATAAYTTAELCHFLGREQVCAFFTWPASASGGFLTSYARTTESAEFAVAHLVKTIRHFAQMPEVKKLQLLAHSRGTAVLLSALRELALQSIAKGVEPADVLKIDNVILFSPDIDTDLARQKIDLFVSDPDLISSWSAERLPRRSSVPSLEKGNTTETSPTGANDESILGTWISPFKVQKYNIHNQNLSSPMMASQVAAIKV